MPLRDPKQPRRSKPVAMLQAMRCAVRNGSVSASPRLQGGRMKRREFISTTCASVLVTWPLLASAQPRSAVPVIGFLSSRSADGSGQIVSAFQRGLNEAGYVDGRSVAIEYRWANFKNE